MSHLADFRQTLPILRCGSRAQTVDASIKSSALWSDFTSLALTENMRVENAVEGNREVLASFSEWLLSIGEGAANDDEGMVELPDSFCQELGADGVDGLDALIDWTFPELEQRCSDPKYIAERAILAPLNASVDEVNERILRRFPGESTLFHSADSTPVDEVTIPVEQLNAHCVPGIPDHKLELKIGMVLVLLRNLNPRDGLCNGTRLILRGISHGKLLVCEIASGAFAKRTVLIPRIDLQPEEGGTPYKWTRRQFPVRAAFCMTINKAQVCVPPSLPPSSAAPFQSNLA